MPRLLAPALVLAIPLLFATGAYAASAAGDTPIPQTSTERFLRGVPDYAGGKPSSNMLYSTRAVGEAANSPPASRSGGAPVATIPWPEHKPLSSSSLPGGQIQKTPITKSTIERSNTPSGWR